MHAHLNGNTETTSLRASDSGVFHAVFTQILQTGLRMQWHVSLRE